MNPKKNKQTKVQECICNSNTLIGLIVNNILYNNDNKSIANQKLGRIRRDQGKVPEFKILVTIKEVDYEHLKLNQEQAAHLVSLKYRGNTE